MKKPKIILSKTLRDEQNKLREKKEGPNYKACLDFGFVRLTDSMGDDEAIEQAARVSYGEGTRKTSEIRGLIRYLLKHQHTTPFEMVEFKFQCKMPMFVARCCAETATPYWLETGGMRSFAKDGWLITNNDSRLVIMSFFITFLV